MIKTLTLFLAATWLLVSLWGCKPAPPSSEVVRLLPKNTNVILITLDTTRADRLGCYGYAEAATPTLDALAERGVLFENAYAQVPLTLPSHASLMTGRYPKEHGIRLNGRSALSSVHPTLAELFQSHGYATGAFVASSVLDSRYRLDRGFEVYHDDMGLQKDSVVGADVQRRADRVVDDALDWLTGVNDKPFFGWIHFYDPHQPYDPPAPYRETQDDPYDGEIAFVDAQIKRLVTFLDTHDLRGKTMIVVVGDHGESFGEHGETGHTLFLYRTNLHVPLMIGGPSWPVRRRIDAVAEVVDVFPTILSAFGWTLPEGLLSRSLRRTAASEESDAGSYAESLYGHGSFAWAQQHALTTRRWKYISSTIPELYDLSADPAERHDVRAVYPEVAEQMRDALFARYGQMAPSAAGAVSLTPQARRELESLGYLPSGGRSVSQDFLTPDAPDPKTMVQAYTLVTRSQTLLARGELKKAIPLLEQAVQASPGSATIQFLLGSAYQRGGNHTDAIGPLLAGLRLDPENPDMLLMVAGSLASVGRNDEAEEHYRAALAFDVIAKNHKRAATVRYNLAVIADQRGDRAAATWEYEHALAMDPSHEKSVSALVNIYLEAKRVGDAVRVLRETLPHAPDSVAILRPLASLLATAPDADMRNGKRAVALALRAVSLTQRQDPIVLATLAAAHAETGQFDRAVRIGQEAAEVARGKKAARLAHFIDSQVSGYQKGHPFRDISLRRD